MPEWELVKAELDGISRSHVGFVSASGYAPDCDDIPNLIAGEDLYRDKAAYADEQHMSRLPPEGGSWIIWGYGKYVADIFAYTLTYFLYLGIL